MLKSAVCTNANTAPSAQAFFFPSVAFVPVW